MKRVTIKDIARKLGVAPSTVSRALADHPDISADTKARVRLAAESLGYIPNFSARHLRARHSRLIGLIVPEMNMFFVPSLISGINRVLGQHAYSLLVFQSEDSQAQEHRLVELCLNLSMDGVLLTRSSETEDYAYLDRLRSAEVPVVLLDKVIETSEYCSVTIDDAEASREAVGYLLDRGHRAILGLFGDDRLHITACRMKGYQQAFNERGLTVNDHHVLMVSELSAFDRYFDRLLDTNPDATALFVMSDELLVRAHYCLSRRGHAIPTDLSLIAISDGHAPFFLHPNVTHLLDSGAEMGQKAANLLLGMIDHSSDGIVNTQIRTPLVELESVTVRPVPA